ncbi:hypothetical protein [Proteus cibi]|uniref:hypothetical protein n=1 Tax=Proteus cibi TaxID=2050966 RepID=UPI000D693ADC|nr:hypothetical protein [Proteus cibi]
MTSLSEIQRNILIALNNRNYPMKPISNSQLTELEIRIGKDTLACNINYLQDQGLIKDGAIQLSGTGKFVYILPKMALTSKGFDYINEDSIGNELNSVTIKIHQDTINKIESMIHDASISDAEKTTLIRYIKEKGVESVIGKCIDILISNTGSFTKLLSDLAKSIM